MFFVTDANAGSPVHPTWVGGAELLQAGEGCGGAQDSQRVATHNRTYPISGFLLFQPHQGHCHHLRTLTCTRAHPGVTQPSPIPSGLGSAKRAVPCSLQRHHEAFRECCIQAGSPSLHKARCRCIKSAQALMAGRFSSEVLQQVLCSICDTRFGFQLESDRTPTDLIDLLQWC